MLSLPAIRSALISAFILDRKAVTAIEYALIAAFLATVIVGAVTQVGANLPHSLNTVASEL
jgi:Flp pilus assembly pilin Flp